MRLFCRAVSLLVILAAAPAYAAEMVRQIPDEYETTSGHGVALNNAGYAANDGASSVRANPALLAGHKEYTISAGYHWPTQGRDFYQASVVDSKTSSIAAGVTYTGYTDDYVSVRDDRDAPRFDSPVVRRGVIGLAQNFGALFLGAGATYVEAHDLSPEKQADSGDPRVKGAGMNLGVAGAISPDLTLGASVENTSNRKIKDYAPQTYRAGAAYAFNKTVMGFLDFRQRDRVAMFEKEIDPDADPADEAKLEPEQMVIASLTAQVQDFLRLVGSYGSALDDERRSLAGGVAVVNKNFSLSYTIARPYMKQSTDHQAVTLSVEMAM